MSELKVGDRVRIRKDLVENEVYGGTDFIDEMLKFRGELAKIVEIIDTSIYLDIDDNDWVWSEEMFEQHKTKLSKKEFDKLYVGEKIAVHCHTEELANEFLKEADQHGYKWKDQESYIDKKLWSCYKENTCYSLVKGGLGRKSWFENFNYKIIKFKGFDKIKKNEQETYTYEILPHKYNAVIRNTKDEIVDIQEIDSRREKYKVIFNDLATIVILDNGSKGVARCNPSDTYDFQKGHDIAYKRAILKSMYKELDRLVK